MKNRKLIEGVVIFSAFALIVGGVLTAQAADDSTIKDFFKNKGARETMHMNEGNEDFQNLSADEKEALKLEREANRELIETAISNNDYETWLSLAPEDCPLMDEITADNFSEYKDQLLDNNGRNGLKNAKMNKRGNGIRGNEDFKNLSTEEKEVLKTEKETNRAEIETAIENDDYATWSTLVPTDCPIFDEINEDNFSDYEEKLLNMKGRQQHQRRGMKQAELSI